MSLTLLQLGFRDLGTGRLDSKSFGVLVLTPRFQAGLIGTGALAKEVRFVFSLGSRVAQDEEVVHGQHRTTQHHEISKITPPPSDHPPKMDA